MRIAIRESFALAALAAGAVGCSGPTQVPVYQTQGRVLYNSKAATGAIVLLHPVGGSLPDGVLMTPNGTVEIDGSFLITTYNNGDGAPAGDYIVGIRWSPPAASEDQDTGDDRFRGKYSAEKSPIRFTVKSGENVIPEIRLP